MRRYENFSPHDFELFIADLLGAELGLRFEAFPRGADGGIDLRAFSGNRGRPHIVQCKHYEGSTFSKLRTAARNEATALRALRPQPLTYRFVTSQPLTPNRKRQIAAELSPWIRNDGDVFGVHDLEVLLNRHAEVERRQVKLWLTGGTQLAALLHAGTLNRSQTLLEEIEQSMSRYVQGAAFVAAREQLRTEHVLVVAGVPGIGKTMLARILLADAVLDGYEAIDVSRDIEEAWELVDDSTKQVFLYDDFLGRTALAERFAKNEDRRLMDFIGRAARRRSTLFVLTTREYILRQAAQFYERLELERLDGRRFLLELTSYSRVDRARIFANHAFFSPNLNVGAKEALLAGQAYRRIIDHRNYNPRTIEWITGMAGHRLTEDELSHYVDFAVRALDHPDRIWKHAFENEIDEHGRHFLFVLATLSPVAGIDHLEQAFEEACRTLDLSTGGQAFTRTLSALDDSLVRTAHTEDGPRADLGIAVRCYDTSIIDFLADYLRQSPGDARNMAKGALFFEQIEWLYGTLRVAGESLPESTSGEIAGALMRTFEAPGLRTVRIPVGPNAWAERPRGTRDVEARLQVVYEIAKATGQWQEPLLSWWQSMLAARVRQWEAGNGEPPSLLRLLETVDHDDVEGFDRAVEAAKKVMRSGWSFIQSCQWLIELRSHVPAAFPSEEWSDFINEFEAWSRDDLRTAAAEMSSEDELSSVLIVAEELGVEIDEEDVQEAEEIVRSAVEEYESGIDPDPDYNRPSHDSGNYASESREIEAIFQGLVEES